MFWENKYDYTIIDKDITDEILNDFLITHNVCLRIIDNSTRWCAFAQYYAYKHSFDIVKAASFSYMVSLFMTEMGVSAGTEMYFKEEQLELDLIDYLNEVKSKISNEEEQVKNMFNHIFEVYDKNISKYEYATERLSLRLTPSEMEKFQSIEGTNNTEKFKNLLNKK